MFRAPHFYLVVCGLACAIVTGGSRADEWTNLRGTSTVSAKLVGIWNGRALLRMDDGRQVSVKLDDLNATSRIKAQDQQEEIERLLRTRVTELDAVATEAAAPAPVTLPAPAPAPAYVPPGEGADLQSTLDHLQSQARAGHIRVYYDALPKSQQAQADQMFQLALQKLDPANFELFRSTLQRLADLTVTRQRWLFSHPKFAQLTDTQRSLMLTLATATRELAAPDMASLASLQKRSLGETLAQLDAILAPYLHQIVQSDSMIASLLSTPYQVESGPNGTMLAKTSLPLVGTVQSSPMVQIEGRWVQGASAADVQTQWDTIKKQLESVPDRSLRFGTEAEAVLNNLSNLLSSLETAASRNEFHRALDEVTTGMLPAINTWAGVRAQTGYENYDSYDPSMQENYIGPSSGSDPAAAPAQP